MPCLVVTEYDQHATDWSASSGREFVAEAKAGSAQQRTVYRSGRVARGLRMAAGGRWWFAKRFWDQRYQGARDVMRLDGRRLNVNGCYRKLTVGPNGGLRDIHEQNVK